jgi:DNA polymerase-3 subunit gamma/tau
LNNSLVEQASVERDGLSLIARASEGSVRDGLSLLDQAIVQGGQSDAPVSALQVRDMLGLADRVRVLDLLEHALSGQTSEALAELASLHDAGGDPAIITRDLLDYVHALSRVKAVGKSADLGEAAETVLRMAEMAEPLTLGQLTRFWKLMLVGLDDVRTAPDSLAAAEMTILRLIAAAMLPPPEDAARLLATTFRASAEMEAPGKPELPPAAKASGEAVADTPALKVEADSITGPTNFEALVRLLRERRDIGLQSDVERYFRPVSVKSGAITFEPGEGAPVDLAQRLARRLQEWTDAPWLVLADANVRGGETWAEKRIRDREERLENASRDPAVAEALRLFPGAEIVNVSDPEDMTETPAGDATENRA